jgi:hypothetical protein
MDEDEDEEDGEDGGDDYVGARHSSLYMSSASSASEHVLQSSHQAGSPGAAGGHADPSFTGTMPTTAPPQAFIMTPSLPRASALYQGARPYTSRSEPEYGRSPSPGSSAHSAPDAPELVAQQQQSFNQATYQRFSYHVPNDTRASVAHADLGNMSVASFVVSHMGTAQHTPSSPSLGSNAESNYVIGSPLPPPPLRHYSHTTVQPAQNSDPYAATATAAPLNRGYSEPSLSCQGPFYYSSRQCLCPHDHHYQPSKTYLQQQQQQPQRQPPLPSPYLQEYQHAPSPSPVPTMATTTINATPSPSPTTPDEPFYAPPDAPPPGFGIEPARTATTGNAGGSMPLSTSPVVGPPPMMHSAISLGAGAPRGIGSTCVAGGGGWDF